MDILGLRVALETLLVDYLGSYQLGNGTVTPAIHVRSYGEPLAAGTTVTGLELVLIRDPALDPLRQYNAQEAFRTWTAFLVNWDDTGRLEDAAAMVVRAFPGTSVSSLPIPEGLGPRHQMRLEIPTNPPKTVIC